MRLVLVILLLVGFSCPVFAQSADLRIALWVSDLKEARTPPASRGQYTGLAAFNEELAREICRRIQARCITERVLFSDILPGVESRVYDLGFGNFLRTPEREKRVAFSDAIWSSASRLVGREDVIHRLEGRFGKDFRVDKLRDIRVGGVAATQQFTYLEGIAVEQKLSLTAARTMAEALALLGDGRVDLCLLPMLSAYDLMRRESAGRYEFVGPPLVDHGLGGTVHIALAKEQNALRQSVNVALAGLRADGTYHRLVRQHFPFSLE